MRRLTVHDPVASLPYSSDHELFEDLIARIRMLEERLRVLEESVKQPAVEQREAEVIRV